MTSNTCAPSLVCRCRRSQRSHTSASARHTCSIVHSGFFPPKPLGMLGDEPHCCHAQTHVPHQSHIVAAFKVGKAQFRLAHPETVFHIGAAERHTHQPLYG